MSDEKDLPDPLEGFSSNKPKISSESSSDLFDLTSLRLSQNFGEHLGVKKVIVTVPVRKPDSQWFVRTHADWRLDTFVLHLKEDNEFYLIDPSLWSALQGELIPMAIFAAINRQGVVFLWPIRLPGLDGMQLEWHRSALEAAELAMTKWIRVAANMSLGAYDVSQASADLAAPSWPDCDFQQLLNVAFKDRFIRALDHPAIRKLRGEI